MKFTKMQGAGNDFAVIETGDTGHNWSALAMAMCNRHFGVGADGLLLLSPSSVADFRMQTFNADGSEATACGNGLRCLVKYFVDGKESSSGDGGVSVETIAGVRKTQVHKGAGKTAKIMVGMGEPGFGPRDIPVAMESGLEGIVDIKSMITYPLNVDDKELRLNLVSMGNPHAVYFQQDPVADFPLAQVGPKIEHHQIFSRGVNFEVVRILDRQKIEARVWERGVGETLACGSGACAITVAAQLHGYADKKVDIVLPGGVLEVEWDGVGEVFLSGPAETVYSGEWPD